MNAPVQIDYRLQFAAHTTESGAMETELRKRWKPKKFGNLFYKFNYKKQKTVNKTIKC